MTDKTYGLYNVSGWFCNIGSGRFNDTYSNVRAAKERHGRHGFIDNCYVIVKHSCLNNGNLLCVGELKVCSPIFLDDLVSKINEPTKEEIEYLIKVLEL